MITKKPLDSTNYSLALYYTSSARAGWYHLLTSLKLETTEYVLLPAYIGFTQREGSGVFDPILESGVNYYFYKVNADLSVDMEDLELKLKDLNVKVLLIIHYFGFNVNRIDDIAGMCRVNGAYLVEDCAHAYNLHLPGYELGSLGDFSFYSLHKYFSVESGGLLRVNKSEVNIPPPPDHLKCAPSVIEKILSFNVHEIALRRIANYKYLYEQLVDHSFVRPMYKLKDDIIPHDFPVIVKNGLREKLYFKLMECDVPTIALYYQLIDVLSDVEFPVSFEISSSILNLPVHQDITQLDLKKMVEKIDYAINEIVQ